MKETDVDRMKYDITLLTFLPDPTTSQAGPNSLSASIPVGITRTEELFASLNEQLHFPTYFGENWDSLHEMLRSWANWTDAQRVVIVHQDLPLLEKTANGWFWLKIYLETVMDSIAFMQKNSEKELVAIFPSDTYEALYGVLIHPPVWEMQFGFREQYVRGIINASWPEIMRYLEYLDGLTAEICTIFREDIGTMTVQYLRKTEEYYVEYNAQNPRLSCMASPSSDTSFPAGFSFSQARQIMEEFFMSGHCSASIQWLTLETYYDPGETLEHLSYLNDEEEFIEGRESTIRETIIQGILQAPLDRGNAFSDSWKNVLLDQNMPISQRVTALCVIGSSPLPEKAAFFLPFFESTAKKERWVSAVFLGMMGNERVIPMLLSMLTDELPILVKESWSQQEHWYEDWRPSAPRLLRKWQTAEVLAGLQHALAQWIQAEPFFDPDYGLWRAYEAELCYELGYRGDLATCTTLTLEEEHRQMLMIDAARGYLTAKKHLSLHEEYVQQKHFWGTYRSMQKEVLTILDEQFGIPQPVAEGMLRQYRQKNEYTF